MKRLLPLLLLLPFIFGAGKINLSSDNLAGYWPLTSGAIQSATVGSDRSIYDNHCTVNGAPPSFTATGITLSSATNDYLDCGDTMSFTDGAGNDKPFSTIMRITPISQTNVHMFAKMSGAAREFAISAGSATAGKLGLTLYTNASNSICKRPTTAYSDTGTEHCYATTYDGSEVVGGIKLYRDGIETTAVDDCSSGSYTGMADTSDPLKIGYNGFSYSNIKVSYGRIYNRLLSADQIATECERNKAGSDMVTSNIYTQLVLDLPLITGWGEGTLATDREGRNHATLIGTPPVLGADGVDLNGTSDYISVGTDLSFNVAGQDQPFSLGCWVYMHDATSFQMIRKDGVTSNREYVLVTTSSDLLAIVVYTDGSNYIGIITTSAVTARENQWTLFTGTYDGSESHTGMALYQNGIALATSPFNSGTHTGMVPSVQPVEIARRDGSVKIYSDGKVSFCFIQGRELSADENDERNTIGRKVFSVNVTP